MGSRLPSIALDSHSLSLVSPQLCGGAGAQGPARPVRLDPSLLGVWLGSLKAGTCLSWYVRGAVRQGPGSWSPQEGPRCTEGARGRLAPRCWNSPFQVLRPCPLGAPSPWDPATGDPTPLRSSNRGSSPMNSGRGVRGSLVAEVGKPTGWLPRSDAGSCVSLSLTPRVSPGSRALACASGWAARPRAPCWGTERTCLQAANRSLRSLPVTCSRRVYFQAQNSARPRWELVARFLF